GFRVLSVERLSTHPIWKVRLRGSLDVQARLLLGKKYPARMVIYAKSSLLLELRLRAEMALILRQLQWKGKSEDIVVVRHGGYFQVHFVWAVGSIGLYRPVE